MKFWNDMPLKTVAGTDLIMVGDPTTTANANQPYTVSVSDILNYFTNTQGANTFTDSGTPTITSLGIVNKGALLVTFTNTTTNATESTILVISKYLTNFQQIGKTNTVSFSYDTNTSKVIYSITSAAAFPATVTVSAISGSDFAFDVTNPTTVGGSVFSPLGGGNITLSGQGGVVNTPSGLAVEASQALNRYTNNNWGVYAQRWLACSPGWLQLYAFSSGAQINTFTSSPNSYFWQSTDGAARFTIDNTNGLGFSFSGNTFALKPQYTSNTKAFIHINDNSGINYYAQQNPTYSFCSLYTDGNVPHLAYTKYGSDTTIYDIDLSQVLNSIQGLTAGTNISIDLTNPQNPTINGATIQAGANTTVTYDSTNNTYTINSSGGGSGTSGVFSVINVTYSNYTSLFAYTKPLIGTTFTATTTQITGLTESTLIIFTDIYAVAACVGFDSTSNTFTFEIISEFGTRNYWSVTDNQNQYGATVGSLYALDLTNLALIDGIGAQSTISPHDIITDANGNQYVYTGGTSGNALCIGLGVPKTGGSTTSGNVIVAAGGQINGITGSTTPLSSLELNTNKVDLTSATNANQYPTAQSVKTYVDATVGSAVSGGLKTPITISLESLLPSASSVSVGTYYMVQNMDISQPNKQGQAWVNYTNPADTTSALMWYKIVDNEATPDGVTITTTSVTNQLQINPTLLTTIGSGLLDRPPTVTNFTITNPQRVDFIIAMPRQYYYSGGSYTDLTTQLGYMIQLKDISGNPITNQTLYNKDGVQKTNGWLTDTDISDSGDSYLFGGFFTRYRLVGYITVPNTYNLNSISTYLGISTVY